IGPLPVRRSGAAETAVRLAGGTCAESGQRSGQRAEPAQSQASAAVSGRNLRRVRPAQRSAREPAQN
ncbi:hypothetical protein, partial [Pantoea sp.]|uniref:hypothetical protein n=1 Tax=Pantoea sp. TaxID=69393 RepID=UPI0031D1451A